MQILEFEEGSLQLIPDTAERLEVLCRGRLQRRRRPRRLLPGCAPYPETRADVQRVIGLYGGVRHAFDENLTVASPWLAAGGR